MYFLHSSRLKIYSPGLLAGDYWNDCAGNEISDLIDRTPHLGYAFGSLLLVLCLFISLYTWYKKYKNLEVYPIFEREKEILFWVDVLFSNSLGTAFGDFLSDNLELTYFYGAMITGGIILIMVMLHYYTKLNRVILFWIAFVFTRPFGDTFGDFLTKSADMGGLDLGTLPSSIISIAIMTIFVYISHGIHKRSKKEMLNI